MVGFGNWTPYLSVVAVAREGDHLVTVRLIRGER
jgi:hypothetical protein